MKKTYYILIILILYIISLIGSILLFSEKDEDETPVINKNFSFYKDELIDEYIKYKNKHNTLTDKEIILNVNIGLNKPFYTNPKAAVNLNKTNILVNKFNYLPSNYIPSNLVELDEYAKEGIMLVSEAYEAFKRMAKDASLDNLKLRIVSAYRSFNYQKGLYNNYLKYDSQEVVDTYSARPGFSEHQTGLAIDIDNELVSYDKFHLTQEYNWVKNNCYKYGFILRYGLNQENITGYKYEPWHYRYVGTQISEYIYKKNITYEEYYHEFIEKND